MSSPSPQSPLNLSNGPLGLSPLDTKFIQQDIPKDGTCLLELFGGINFGLITILQLGILIWRYHYVEKHPQVEQASMRHVMMLQQKYPHLLPTSTIHGYQHFLPNNITLLRVPNLARIGPIHLVIFRWMCQGLSQVSMGQGFSNPKLGLFWELIYVVQHL